MALNGLGQAVTVPNENKGYLNNVIFHRLINYFSISLPVP